MRRVVQNNRPVHAAFLNWRDCVELRRVYFWRITKEDGLDDDGFEFDERIVGLVLDAGDFTPVEYCCMKFLGYRDGDSDPDGAAIEFEEAINEARAHRAEVKAKRAEALAQKGEQSK
jgi:hypothetical protein